MIADAAQRQSGNKRNFPARRLVLLAEFLLGRKPGNHRRFDKRLADWYSREL